MRNSVYARLGVLAGLVAGAASAAAGLAAGPVGAVAALADAKVQQDFPAICIDRNGTPWAAYVAWDGKADVLKVARRADGELKTVATVAGPGVIHQPAIACGGKGAIWVVWSQANATNVMDLHARQIGADGKVAPKTLTLATSSGAGVLNLPEIEFDDIRFAWPGSAFRLAVRSLC